jgi:membrane protein implicated in regulation of membrane protease activity
MESFIKILESYGLPVAFLAISIVAVWVLWKELRRKDKQYLGELKEVYDKLNDRSKEFADTLNRFMNMFGGRGGSDS